MSMEYIRKTYKVPAKRGGRIKYTGSNKPMLGTITSATNYLRVRMDSEKRRFVLHPTWKVEYL